MPMLSQRVWPLLSLLLLLAAAQHVSGLKELAGAEIQGNDMCPPGVKQQAAPPAPPPRTGSSLTRLFSGSSSSSSSKSSRMAQEAGTRAPACRAAYKVCGDVVAVAERCKQTLGCRAFTYDGRCGYLKSAGGPRTARRGWSTYIVA